MFNDFKTLYLQDLASQLQDCARPTSDALQKYQNELFDLESTLGPNLQQLSTIEGKQFSFIERHFTKKKEVELQKKLNEYNKLQSAIEGEKARLDKAWSESGNKAKYVALLAQQDVSKNAKCIQDLGISFAGAVKYLQDRNIPISLDESDQHIYEHNSEFSDSSSLVGVHLTNFAPNGDTIQTTKSAGGQYSKDITINGQNYNIKYNAMIDSVHMGLNCPVSNGGNWDKCAIAVLMPIANMDKNKFGSVEASDTYTNGDCPIPKGSVIICPEQQVEKMKTDNPNTIVVSYEKGYAKDYCPAVLSQMGYKFEQMNNWSWINEDSVAQLKQLKEKESLPSGHHSYTWEFEDLKKLEKINMAVSLAKTLSDNNLLDNSENISTIMNELKGQSVDFATLLSDICSSNIHNNENSVFTQHKQIDYLSQKMEEVGLPLSSTYKQTLQNLCEQPPTTRTYDDKIFDISDSTPEEKTTLQQLQESLNSNPDKKFDCIGAFMTKVMTSSINTPQQINESYM